MKVYAHNGIGGFEVSLIDEKRPMALRTSTDTMASMRINDEDLNEVVMRALERLAGQAMVSEKLRTMCYNVGAMPHARA